jgi:FG-GAP-like repeat
MTNQFVDDLATGPRYRSRVRIPGGPPRAGGLAALAVLAAAGCINFEPATPAQASTVEAARSVDAVFADVTGDGADDVVVAMSLPGTDAIVRMARCGDGCLERREEIPVGDTVRDLAVGDVDGDGVDDIVVVTTGPDQLVDGEVQVFFGGPATTGRPEGLVADDSVVAATADPSLEPWTEAATGDLDGDGDVDLALTSTGLYHYVAGDGAGGFAAPVIVALLPSRASLTGLAVGDVDGDGQQEVAISVSGLGIGDVVGSVSVFENGTTSVRQHDENSRRFGDVAAGDIDGDGIDDVAVATSDALGGNANVRLLRSTGAAFTGFGTGGALTSVAEDGSGLVLRDLDLDGHVDLLAAGSGEVRSWQGTGTGTFASQVRRDAGPSPRHPELGTRSGAPGPDVLVSNIGAPFAQISYLGNASQLPE